MSTSIAIDQGAALAASTDRLLAEFADRLEPDTISRFLQHSYDELSTPARFGHHLPLLAERFARQRLTALARIEGEHSMPIVLFLCAHNSGRSQMAMGFLARHASTQAVGWSGGSHPAETINPAVVAAMAERAVDISAEYPKPWTDEVLRAADAVVTMGCGDACPIISGKTYEEWDLTDPEGLTVEEIRPIRDEIERRVLTLLARLTAP
ncbi:arsenate reductase ArsC [Aeromicrobium sp. Sec7.5]|uniref:arsenate reductase ArsC n=1 Tax=Aeromicrobium sp. Sec7.5 TaxID=3121276 RepID=UPI002FE4DCBD